MKATTTQPKGSPASDLFAIGSRWLINYGFGPMTVVIYARGENVLAWKAESNGLCQMEAFEDFQSHRKPIALPPKSLPWWKRLFGMANAELSNLHQREQ